MDVGNITTQPKTRQAGRANEQSIHSHMSMVFSKCALPLPDAGRDSVSDELIIRADLFTRL